MTPKLPDPPARSMYGNLDDLLHAYGLACWKQGMERAAEICEPTSARPCDCTICDCGNPAIYDAALNWRTSKANADAIRKEITP